MGKGKNRHSNRTQHEISTGRHKKREKQRDKLSSVISKQNQNIPDILTHKKHLLKEISTRGNCNNTQVKRKLQDGLTQRNPNLQTLLMNSQQNFTQTEDDQDDKSLNRHNVDLSRKVYLRELKQVIEASDVILEVLDARDPLLYRSKQLEQEVLSFKDRKKLIIVLNKIDLVSSENANSWKQHLSKEFPTVLFKANTQNQSSNLSNVTLYHSSITSQKDFIDDVISSNAAVGGEDIMNILKNYCRVGEGKKSLVVGIVGFPNVGKSSIINSLKRGKVVGVSPTPGFTKNMQEIVLDKHIKLLDCPGVVYSNEASSVHALTNVIRTENIEDPVEVVRQMFKRVEPGEILKEYGVEDKGIDVNDEGFVDRLMCHIAMKMGKYKKGGIADLDKAARIVIQDWNRGKLKYMSKVPDGQMNLD